MTAKRRGAPLELWGGVECTIVRIGDEYRDQIVETGHAAAPSDIDPIAELGIKTVRFPILWETIAPDGPTRLDCAWHDERLARLRELGINVIGGLVHHGTGRATPACSIPTFPDQLADYAAARRRALSVDRGAGRRSTSR